MSKLIVFTAMTMTLLLMTSKAGAEQVYVHASKLSMDQFQAWLSQEKKSGFLETYKRKIQLLNLEKMEVSEDPGIIRSLIQTIESVPLRSNEAGLEVHLWERLGIAQLTFQERQRYLGIVSLRLALDSHQKELIHQEAQRSQISPTEIKNLLTAVVAMDEAIFIDGVELKSEDQLISDWPHQWVYISNSYQPIMQTGGLKDFAKALNDRKSFSEICGPFETNWTHLVNLPIFNSGNGRDCALEALSARPVIAGKNSTLLSFENQWQEKMNWIIPVTLVTGGLAWSYLHNKQVNFRFPSLKF